MRSVLFFIESLGRGGAERIFASFIENTGRRYDVFTETDGEVYTDIIKAHSNHRCMVKKTDSKIKNLVNKIKVKISLAAPEAFVRNFFIKGKYDVEVAFCEGYSTKIIGNSPKKNCKKIAWVHTDMIKNPWSESIFGSAEAEKKCYENFDAIVCVAETMREAFIQKYGMAQKVFVLYNPIDFENIIKKSNEALDFKLGGGMKFVLAGSFVKVKGYERFVSVCKRLKNEGFYFSVLIMGEGEEKENITKLIAEKGLDGTIKIADFQTNPYKYIKASDVFVCASYAEGYSTAVSEAVTLNVPVITTECSGMREIFGKNGCGIICENSEDGLYNSMKKVLENPELLKKFSAEEKIRAKDFSLKSRVEKYEDFFERV